MALVSVARTACSQVSEDIVIGRKSGLHSGVLNKDIQLSIHIPASYQETDKQYPVLYIFQTHFEQVSGAVKSLYDYDLTPEIIVVRIDNYEFGYLTPTRIKSNPNSGQADNFLQFFKEELFPFIDASYRTHPYRIVFSNSWGAMFGAYAILARPDVFNAAIASIPWVNYDGEERYMIKNVERFLNSGKYNANYLFMTMDDESELLPDLEIFIGKLKNSPRPGLKWEYHHWQEEDHTSTPYRSVYTGLRRLFEGWNQIPADIVEQGLGKIREYESSLDTDYGYDIGVSHSALRGAGRELQNKKRYEAAIAVYEYGIEKNPDNPFAYVTLGKAYEENNQIGLARKAFEEGYRIAVETSHPQMKWVKSFVDRIVEKIRTEKNGN
jgi:tetratricopeptide (TPR) repeat protein